MIVRFTKYDKQVKKRLDAQYKLDYKGNSKPPIINVHKQRRLMGKIQMHLFLYLVASPNILLTNNTSLRLTLGTIPYNMYKFHEKLNK